MKIHYWEWIRNHIDAEKDTIIDLGYGDGNTWKMGYMGKHDEKPPSLPKYNVVAVDYNVIETDYPFINDDLCRFIKNHEKHYSVAVMSHVLEHVLCPTELISWGLNHADRVLIVVPIGHSEDLVKRGDEMAKNNPWAKFKEFRYDSECPHNAHIREFMTEEDFMKYLPDEALVVEKEMLEDVTGTKSFACVVVKK